jgi:hypothetical protein
MSAHERERLSAWLDDELAVAERAEVDAHLATCAECRSLLADMAAVGEMAREQSLEAPPGYFESFAGRVRTRIEASQTSPRAGGRPRASWRVPAWTWAAAAALILGVVTPVTMVRLGREEAHVARDQRPGEPTDGGKRAEVVAPPAPVFAPESEPDVPVRTDEAPAAAARNKREVTAAQLPSPPASPPEPRPMDNRAREEEKDADRVAGAPVGGRLMRQEPSRPSAAAPRPQAMGADAAGSGGLLDLEVRGTARPEKSATAKVPPLHEGLGRADMDAPPEDVRAFALLAGDAPSDAAAWRARREAWRGFVDAHPDSPLADPARLQVIQAGIEAWRAGGDPEDLAFARSDAEAYLARGDAQHAADVRKALEAIESQ